MLAKRKNELERNPSRLRLSVASTRKISRLFSFESN